MAESESDFRIITNTPSLVLMGKLWSVFSWWRHPMETFSALLAICAGNSSVTGHKGQWRGALMFSLICAWINGWVNNLEAGDLRCHRAHYHVIVMSLMCEDFVEYWRHYNSTALWNSCLHLCLLIFRIAEEGHQLKGHNDRQCSIFWERTIEILMVYLHKFLVFIISTEFNAIGS